MADGQSEAFQPSAMSTVSFSRLPVITDLLLPSAIQHAAWSVSGRRISNVGWLKSGTR
jgi:hypothetical protein